LPRLDRCQAGLGRLDSVAGLAVPIEVAVAILARATDVVMVGPSAHTVHTRWVGVATATLGHRATVTVGVPVGNVGLILLKFGDFGVENLAGHTSGHALLRHVPSVARQA